MTSFATKDRFVAAAMGGRGTTIGIYSAGDGAFILRFGELGYGEFQIITTCAGLETIIAACQATLVRFQIAAGDAPVPVAADDIPDDDFPF